MDLNGNWNISTGGVEYSCDLPHDVTASAPRDYSCAFGELNGYHPATRAVFTKTLPALKGGKSKLVISGACGVGEVYINDERVCLLTGYAPTEADITEKLTSGRNVLRIAMTSVPGMSDKYTGLGIAGGVKLVVSDEVDIAYDSLYVTTSAASDKTYAEANVTVINNGPSVKLVLECAAFNARGKRAGVKTRKIFMRAGACKTFTVRVRIARAYEWSPDDPYMYSMTATLKADGNELASASAPFGIITRLLSPIRGLYYNNKNVKFMGAYVSHADCALGGISNYSNEVRRFTALKNLGYNAVHLVECPTEATLDALDDVGLYAFVDIFGCLGEGKAPLDGHIFLNENNIAAAVTSSVSALRKHPCVAVYGVADDVPECYNRNGGHALISEIANKIRALDPSRPVTVSTHEFVPTQRELEEAGIRRRPESPQAMITAGREKNLFDNITSGAFGSVDICGFNYLYPIYETEMLKHNRLIMGSRTSGDRAFESLDETDKNPRILGDFNDCGIDYPGGGKLNENNNTTGDLDAICDEKPRAVYKRILLGERNIAYITTLDPDTDEPVAMWNWPRYLGKPVTVCVYTSGDVVALYLDGRLLGRKLAGKVNRHIATFTVDFYPGTLEAVCYFKGVECARTVLKSSGTPKTLKLSTPEKSLYVSRGDLGFVRIDVCDKNGDFVPYAMRELSATVTGGKVVSFINADPMLRKRENDVCPAFGGRALCVVKPDESEDRMVVKITGDGVTAAKLTFKVKD